VETGFPDIRQPPFSTIQQRHLADFPETGRFMQPVPAGFGPPWFTHHGLRLRAKWASHWLLRLVVHDVYAPRISR
jgi:hypothetical protein